MSKKTHSYASALTSPPPSKGLNDAVSPGLIIPPAPRKKLDEMMQEEYCKFSDGSVYAKPEFMNEVHEKLSKAACERNQFCRVAETKIYSKNLLGTITLTSADDQKFVEYLNDEGLIVSYVEENGTVFITVHVSRKSREERRVANSQAIRSGTLLEKVTHLDASIVELGSKLASLEAKIISP